MALAALGTYLMRWLPLRMGSKLLSGPIWITLMLSALGVTAMSALVMVSVIDLWQQAPAASTLVSVGLGGFITLGMLKLTGNVGIAAIIGALAYGIALSAF